MQSQNIYEIAAESRALIADCKQTLERLGEQIAECTASREGSRTCWGSAAEPLEVQLLRENARGTRAFSEEANDPEVKRLLLALAEDYELMAAVAGNSLLEDERPQLDGESRIQHLHSKAA